MATLRIPLTSDNAQSPARGQPATFAQLVRRVNAGAAIPFEGIYFRCGSRIEESALHPGAGWPAIPLLLEYAGSDRSGRGHNRSRDVHILWQLAGAEWTEISRLACGAREWQQHFIAVIGREFPAVLFRAAGNGDKIRCMKNLTPLPVPRIDSTVHSSVRSLVIRNISGAITDINQLKSTQEHREYLIVLAEWVNAGIANIDGLEGDQFAVTAA